MDTAISSTILTVVTDQKGPRLDYILDYILKELCGIDYNIVYDIHKIPVEPFIFYCQQSQNVQAIQIVPVGLLSEQHIQTQSIEMGNWLGNPTLFHTQEGSIPFDLFSASFYLISRYEEYLEHCKDKFGRYAHLDSIAFKNNFLHLPLVNIWAKELQRVIMETFPSLKVSPRVSQCIPTYDIDIAWKFKHRSFFRTLGGIVKSMVKGEYKDVIQRIKVICGFEKDPFEVYEWLDALHLTNKLKPAYFFPVANKIKGKDKNIHPSQKAYQDLIAYYAAGNCAGIHPSWQSGDSIDTLVDEVATMETITGKPVYKSRFHYLRFNLPQDYQKLIDVGIIEDYSMGYGTINGFRASVSTSFYWYNLKTEAVTPLMVYPFCWMDATCYYQLKHTAKEAFEELDAFKKSVQQCNGDLIVLSHNNFFSDEMEWKVNYELVVSS